MFELRLALSYLLPRRQHLSRSLMALMSIAVIALVVCLLLVFLSVLGGVESNWLSKMTSLTAPIRINPKEAYYRSYYYKIDQLSAASGYQTKTIREKLLSRLPDPYDPTIDAELPSHFPEPERIDLVKGLYAVLNGLAKEHAGIAFEEYQMAGAILQLRATQNAGSASAPTFLSQATYLLSLQASNPNLERLGVDLSYLPHDSAETPPIWLPKQLQTSGVKVGDRGLLTYPTLGAASLMEAKFPVEVAGFYDPGAISIGHRCALVPPQLVESLQSASSLTYADPLLATGVHLWLPEIAKTGELVSALEQKLEAAGLAPYWSVTPYSEYEFARELLAQFASDRLLFSMVGVLILAVACCTVVASLILLVHDKREEIAILRALGATKTSIAALFGAAGLSMGMISVAVGTLGALLFLSHLDSIIACLSWLEGRPALTLFAVDGKLPSQISWVAVRQLLLWTPLLSLIAGLLPAIAACAIRPAIALRRG